MPNNDTVGFLIPHPIFISYRRSDLSLEAEWLHAFIQTSFGEDIAFLDQREIEGGTRWDDKLEQAVRSARIVLVLIGPAWLTEQSPSGMRRLDDPEDWVRREVVTAIDKHRRQPDRTRVYPVLVNGAKPLPRDWLPEAIVDLTSFQWEPALQFRVRNYLDHAASIHDFLLERLLVLQRAGDLPGLAVRPFRRELVPNPYDIPGYQLPEPLRLRRPEHPFKGLTYFLKGDAPIFFGRHREVAEILDAFKKGRHFIRLFGQSGVGKSSLLFAGLFPRLEGRGWQLSYLRRNATVPMAGSLDAVVQAHAADGDTDALIILDQVEEILTAPNRAAPAELDDLAAAAARLDRLNADRIRPIHLLWAYRKEYDANIKAALREVDLHSHGYWLRDLDAPGMRDAIVGITRDRDLQSEYRLELEPGLANAIVDDLLQCNSAESATPLLQMLLRKMWDRACAASQDTHLFTRELYKECKNTDLLQLVQELLASLASKDAAPDLRYTVQSGLAIDLLERLVSEQNTCLSMAQAELVAQYDDASAVKRLLQALVDHYLLVREDGQRYRLAHDTLARAVRVLHARSELPAQRASRLLDSKAHDINTQPEAVDFSQTDLRTLDEGLSGMRRLRPSEQAAVEASRRRRQQEQLDLQEKNAQLQQALARAECDLLRAQCAELRGVAFRLDRLIAQNCIQAQQGSESDVLKSERRSVAERLAQTTRAHLAALAREIRFRGDFDFLMKWEGNAGEVKLIGPSVFIDPFTDLARAQPEVIRTRYEFLLTPTELRGVLAVTGKRGKEAISAFAAHPVLSRIRLASTDVARIVPEVAETWWRDLLRRYRVLGLPDTPGEVHTALLSLTVNLGRGGPRWRKLEPLISGGQWLAFADAIEGLPMPHAFLRKRRREEAALIRKTLASKVATTAR